MFRATRAERLLNQSKSPTEHAPGPRGSPQEPQAPTAGAVVAGALVETANSDSRASSLPPWQFGHSAFWLP
jgi:hypothetical protein